MAPTSTFLPLLKTVLEVRRFNAWSLEISPYRRQTTGNLRGLYHVSYRVVRPDDP